MEPTRYCKRLRKSPKPGSRPWLAAAAAVCLATAGCLYQAHARLWADTALPDGGFSTQSPQWAYDGEPVTFELECDPGAVHYVVFGTAGQETVVDFGKVAGRYRWTQAFSAGPEPRVCEVYATPYLVRGRRDWVYDKLENTWHFYPGASDRPDVETAAEQVMRITCYRREILVPIQPRSGPPKRIELSLRKADGRRTVVPARPPGKAEARGFLLLGPGKNGDYEIRYEPTYGEVSRAGKTRVDVVVEHADGSTEHLEKDIDTP